MSTKVRCPREEVLFSILALFYFQGTSTFASTYVLVAMSIDRLYAIARPLQLSGSGEDDIVTYPHHLFGHVKFSAFLTYVKCSSRNCNRGKNAPPPLLTKEAKAVCVNKLWG